MSLNYASLGLLTGSCLGALKVPVEVIDNAGFHIQLGVRKSILV